MTYTVLVADYKNEVHGKDIVHLMDLYARDPMGGGKPLKEQVKANLVKALSQRPDAFTILAYDNNTPAGLINCFEGFSTFACKPLVNIHDVVVDHTYRGKGISYLMLEKVESIAKERGCCKLTLEVLSNNHVAKNAYQRYGFEGYELDPEAGSAIFWQKPLP